MVATLTATIVAPVKAGPAAEPLVSVANATLPSITLPGLLDPEGQPALSERVLTEPENPDSDLQTGTADSAPSTRPRGDLPTMVAELRGPEAGSRELEYLAP